MWISVKYHLSAHESGLKWSPAMADTHKREPYHWYRKERKSFRKTHMKAYRRSVKLAMAAGRVIPRFRRTSGWLTW